MTGELGGDGLNFAGALPAGPLLGILLTSALTTVEDYSLSLVMVGGACCLLLVII